jgi:cell division protein ZapA
MDRPITETTVTIRGVAYQIRGDADPGHLERLAGHVDQTMKVLEGSASALSPAKLAILASLTIADEYYREREVRQATVETIRQRADRLGALLDGALGSPETRGAAAKPTE